MLIAVIGVLATATKDLVEQLPLLNIIRQVLKYSWKSVSKNELYLLEALVVIDPLLIYYKFKKEVLDQKSDS